MSNYVAIRILATMLLVYFIIDLITTLISKLIDKKRPPAQEDVTRYLEDTYTIEMDNNKPVIVSQDDDMPDLTPKMAKKVLKEKKKMS